MDTDRYEEQFRQFLTERLTALENNTGLPWVKATDDPILDANMDSYDGLNLLLLTNHCRMNSLKERIFCTYEQRKVLGKPVWKDEKGFLVKLPSGEGRYVFPCPNTKELPERYDASANEKRNLIRMKFRELTFSKGHYEDTDKGIIQMIYDTVCENMLLKDDFNKLVAEIVTASIAAYLGFPKCLDKDNKHLVNTWLSSLNNMRNGMSAMIKKINRQYENLIIQANKIVLDSEKYQTKISNSLNALKNREPEKKILKADEIFKSYFKR